MYFFEIYNIVHCELYFKVKKGRILSRRDPKKLKGCCFDTHEGDSETHHRDAIRTGLPVINLKIASPSVVQICLTVDFEGF